MAEIIAICGRFARRLASDAYHALSFVGRLSAFIGFSSTSLVFFARTLAFGIALVPHFWLPHFAWYFAKRDRLFSAGASARMSGGQHLRIAYGPARRQVVDVFKPACDSSAATGPARLVVFVSGGGWTVGFRLWGLCIARELVRRGYHIALVDYRNHPQTDAAGMVADVRLAITATLRDARLAVPSLDVTLMGQSAGAHLIMMALVQELAEGCGGPLTGSLATAAGAARVARIVAVSGLYDVQGPAFSSQFHRMAGVPRHRALCIFGHTPAAFSPALMAEQLARHVAAGGCLPFVPPAASAAMPASAADSPTAFATAALTPPTSSSAAAAGTSAVSVAWREHAAASGPLARAAADGPCGCLRTACCACLRSDAPARCCDWCGSPIDSDGRLRQGHAGLAAAHAAGAATSTPHDAGSEDEALLRLSAMGGAGSDVSAAAVSSLLLRSSAAAVAAPVARPAPFPTLQLPVIHLYHGTADTTAPPSESLRLRAAVSELYGALSEAGSRSGATPTQPALAGPSLAAAAPAFAPPVPVALAVSSAPAIALTMYEGCTHTDAVLEGPAAGNYRLLDDVCAVIDCDRAIRAAASSTASRPQTTQAAGATAAPAASVSPAVPSPDAAALTLPSAPPAPSDGLRTRRQHESAGAAAGDLGSSDGTGVSALTSGAGAMPPSQPPNSLAELAISSDAAGRAAGVDSGLTTTRTAFWTTDRMQTAASPRSGWELRLPAGLSPSHAAVAIARRINPF